MLKLHLAWLRVDRPDDLNPVEDDLRNLSSDELVALQKAITSQLDQRRIAAGNTITEDERALALSGNAIAAIKQIRVSGCTKRRTFSTTPFRSSSEGEADIAT